MVKSSNWRKDVEQRKQQFSVVKIVDKPSTFIISFNGEIESKEIPYDVDSETLAEQISKTYREFEAMRELRKKRKDIIYRILDTLMAFTIGFIIGILIS